MTFYERQRPTFFGGPPGRGNGFHRFHLDFLRLRRFRRNLPGSSKGLRGALLNRCMSVEGIVHFMLLYPQYNWRMSRLCFPQALYSPKSTALSIWRSLSEMHSTSPGGAQHASQGSPRAPFPCPAKKRQGLQKSQSASFPRPEGNSHSEQRAHEHVQIPLHAASPPLEILRC